MKVNLMLFLITIMLSLMLVSCTYPRLQQEESQFGPQLMTKTLEGMDRKIIVVDDMTTGNVVSELVTENGGRVLRTLDSISALVVALPATASPRAFEALYGIDGIIRIDDDLLISIDVKPDKPGKPDNGDNDDPAQPPEVLPWGVDRIDADEILAITRGEYVKVAVMDTGLDFNHPDLAGNIKGGINIINPRKSPNDDNGHGTHVGGTIAAIDNEIGVIGVASLAELYAVKVLDRRGSGYLSDLIAGLEWCITYEMDVINMSLSAAQGNQSMHEAIIATHNAGITIVCAAGNDNQESVKYPAFYTETIAVSAINADDTFADYSNFGEHIDLAAPGTDIISTYPGSRYAIGSGTSMATPHVAGVAALLLSIDPDLTPDDLKMMLKQNAEWLPDLSSSEQGAGLVDAQEAVLTM